MSNRSAEAGVHPAGPGETVFRNFVTLGAGEAVARLLAFACTAWIARQVGAWEFGAVAFASGATLYLAKATEFGMEVIGAAEIAGDRSRVSRLGSAILSARMVLAAVLALPAIVVSQMWFPDPDRTIFCVYLLTLVPVAAGTKWIHLGLDTARPITLARVAGEVVTLALVVALVQEEGHSWRVPAAIFVGEAVAAGALGYLIFQSGHALRLLWDPELVLPVVRRAAPIVAQGFLGLVIFNSDILLLRLMRWREDVGVYAAAYALVSFLANLCIAYRWTLVPALTRLGVRPGEERGLYHAAMAQMFALAVPLAVGGMFLAEEALRLGFGDTFAGGDTALRILLCGTPALAMRVVGSAALISRRRQSRVLRATAYAVAANVTLNVVLIYYYGIAGAAVATVATELLAGGLMLGYAAREGLPMAPASRFWRATAATLGMAAVLWACADAYVLFRLAAGVTAYLGVLFALGGIRMRNGRLSPSV